MQKPRLTDKTAEALNAAATIVRAHLECMDEYDHDPKVLKRAIEYLEDLLRWKRSRSSAE